MTESRPTKDKDDLLEGQRAEDQTRTKTSTMMMTSGESTHVQES